MSVETKIKNRLSDLREFYDEAMKTVEAEIDLDGVILKNALKNQLRLQVTWETISKQLNHLFDWCEAEMESAYSISVGREVKNSHRQTSITEAKEYAKSDPAYLSLRLLLAEVRLVRDEARGILETIESRKYILNNMTNALVAGVDKTIL